MQCTELWGGGGGVVVMIQYFELGVGHITLHSNRGGGGALYSVPIFAYFHALFVAIYSVQYLQEMTC